MFSRSFRHLLDVSAVLDERLVVLKDYLILVLVLRLSFSITSMDVYRMDVWILDQETFSHFWANSFQRDNQIQKDFSGRIPVTGPPVPGNGWDGTLETQFTIWFPTHT